jgi:hypothetical protein
MQPKSLFNLLPLRLRPTFLGSTKEGEDEGEVHEEGE